MTTEQISKVYLAPGDFYFGGGKTLVHTLLGSCVAITMWHPELSIGGMCHYLLPTRGTNKRFSDGFFAEGAVQLFLKAIREHGTQPHDYQVKLFGGSNMFKALNFQGSTLNIPGANADFGRKFLAQYGFKIATTDLGGGRHRKVMFEIWSGDVWVKQ